MVTVNVRVADGESFDPTGHVVRVILYEEDVTHCCDVNGNDRFPHVGRAITLPQDLVLDAGAGRSLHVLPVDAGWSLADLRMVAFVQAGETGSVVQADAVAAPSSALEPTGWAKVKAAYR